jgi:hypothetical protein
MHGTSSASHAMHVGMHLREQGPAAGFQCIPLKLSRRAGAVLDVHNLVECLEFAVVCADRWAIHLLLGGSSLFAAGVSTLNPKT